MRTALFELQKAIFGRLTADTNLSNKVGGRIYDAVPEDTQLPYCVIGEPIDTPFDTKLSIGENILLTLHIFSGYNGKKESYEILDLMLQALSGSPLQLGGGFHLFNFERSQLNVIYDIDGVTKHGFIDLRFYINN